MDKAAVDAFVGRWEVFLVAPVWRPSLRLKGARLILRPSRHGFDGELDVGRLHGEIDGEAVGRGKARAFLCGLEGGKYVEGDGTMRLVDRWLVLLMTLGGVRYTFTCRRGGRGRSA